MGHSTHQGTHHYEELVTFTEVGLPDGSVTNDNLALSAASPIEAEKVQAQYVFEYAQAEGSDVIDATEAIHICRFAGEVVAVEAAMTGVLGIATGDTVVVDVERHRGAASTSCLTSTLSFSTTPALNIRQQANLDGSNKITVAGDVLKVVINETTASNQGQGILVTVTMREDQAT